MPTVNYLKKQDGTGIKADIKINETESRAQK